MYNSVIMWLRDSGMTTEAAECVFWVAVLFIIASLFNK